MWSEYKSLKSQLKHLLLHHDDKYVHLSNIMSSRSSNKKPFWHYVKRKRQDHSGISTLISTTGTITSESSERQKLLMCFGSKCYLVIHYIPEHSQDIVWCVSFSCLFFVDDVFELWNIGWPCSQIEMCFR